MAVEKKVPRFLLASTIPQRMIDEEAFQELKELSSLVESYGGEVIEILTQRREIHDKGLYIGSGKIEEIATLIIERNIDIVVLNAVVIPGHIFEIYNILFKVKRSIQVWDRVDLILEIFSEHAHTAEARLQIELAAMRHMGPRIYGMGKVLSQQAGGIGTRGIGETNTELMKRHWRKQMKETVDKLERLSKDRERQLARREKIGLKTVSIVGYTNVGKTSLFNLLTKKKNLVENALFATLDSSVGKIKLPNSKKEILISDTIGFIKNLPPSLIDAFKSTLLESIHSDLLLHVIDVSDEDMERKIQTVEDILYELGVYHKERIYVFNKIDMCDVDEQDLRRRYRDFNPRFISVKSGIGKDELLNEIEISISV